MTIIFFIGCLILKKKKQKYLISYFSFCLKLQEFEIRIFKFDSNMINKKKYGFVI